MNIEKLAVSGRKIGLLTMPFLIAGVILNIYFPDFFSVNGPSPAVWNASLGLTLAGMVIWIWTADLILIKVPRNQLITSGPYRLMKHPLYTCIGLMVLPFAGLLFDTWLGIPIGMTVYLGSRLYAPEEEQILAKTFGKAWNEYENKVLLPWI